MWVHFANGGCHGYSIKKARSISRSIRYLWAVPLQINYLDTFSPAIQIELNNASSVLGQYNISPFDIINLCGGVPAPDITSIYVQLHATYASALSVRIVTDQYEVTRRMDFSIGRINNDFMLVHQRGHGLGTNLFLTQVQTARQFHFRQLHVNAIAPDDELDWTGYYFWAELGYENKDVEEYQAWATERGRTEPTLSELVQSDSGRQLWRHEGFAWIGNFYLTDEHPCMTYLRRHLERKGIDFVL